VEPSQALEVATRAFEAGRFHEALAILHEAIPHLEGRARRSARVRKARVLLAVGNGARLAEDELKAALAEDPGNAEAQVALGDMYRDGGSIALAMAYRMALELQPRNVAAREALQALRDPPSVKPAEATSVLKRMFGR
jgi:cytochrome c-type biogenesis protein CcmH/NrfG